MREQSKQWWTSYSTLYPDFIDFIEAATAASGIVWWSTTILPGLLQTGRYSKALLTGGFPNMMGAAAVREHIDARAKLQWDIFEYRAVPCEFLLDQSVLCRRVGGAECLKEQLLHLLEVAAVPTVSIRVLPFEASLQPMPAEGDLIALLAAPQGKGTDSVYFESARHRELVSDCAVFERYNDTLRRVKEYCLSDDDTAQLISELARTV